MQTRQLTGRETQWQAGDVWQYANGTVVRVLDAGPHIGPDWFGGRGVRAMHMDDGSIREHCTRAGRRDALLSPQAVSA